MDYALEQVMNQTSGMEQGKKNYYTDQIEYFVVSLVIFIPEFINSNKRCSYLVDLGLPEQNLDYNQQVT